jgi:hypothetical protein
VPIDDNPIDALKRQFEMEDLSKSPVTDNLLKLASQLPLGPFQGPIGWLRERIIAQSAERNRLLLETIEDEVTRHARELDRTDAAIAAHVARTTPQAMLELLLDAVRKGENTRSKERVKRISLILFNAVAEPKAADEDEVEEMMRVAMELGDRDIYFLKELVKLEGHMLLTDLKRIPRHAAHMRWADGPWGERVDPELDSVFNKLESYGLVSKIAPPNNFNIMADYQNRFVLLPKGSRFVELIRSRAEIV